MSGQQSPPLPPIIPTAYDALAGALASRTGKALILAFALLELLNWAVLPAINETIKTRIIAANAVTENAKGRAAQEQKTSEAAIATEDAAIKSALAAQAERYRKAEAKKNAEEARAKVEIASNSPEVQAAQAEAKQQEAVINGEKAQHEQRRAAAEARKTAAESKIAELQNQLDSATQRANVILATVDEINECIAAKTTEMANQTSDNSGETGIAFGMDLTRRGPLRHSFWRQNCLPQEAAASDAPDPINPTGGCETSYDAWQKNRAAYGAFATSNRNCGWSGHQTTLAAARAEAMAKCGPYCQIYADYEPSEGDPTAMPPSEGDCISVFRGWKTESENYAAFATDADHCGWIHQQKSAEAARAGALKSCGHDDCKIFAEQHR